MLLDEGPQLVATLDANLVQKLYHRGLAYLDVPIKDSDYIFGNFFFFVCTLMLLSSYYNGQYFIIIT